MMRVAPTVSLPRPARTGDGSVLATVALCGLAALMAAATVAAPITLRLWLFVAIGTALVALSLAMPRLGVLTTLSYLVVMALIRRLMIPVAPWSSFDPMLLVAPLVAFVMIVKLFVLERRAVAPDALSKLVLAVLVLTVLQIFNPAGGGPAGGMAGFLFIGVPLLWFFIGRELADDRFVRQALGVVVGAGIVAALYGLWQLAFGFPSWDAEWIEYALQNGLESLQVGNTIRGFGTFSAFLEYALVLASALAVGIAMVMQGRATVILALPLLALALFLSSSRGPLITCVLAVVVMAAVRPRRVGRAVAVIAVGLVLAVGAGQVLSSVSAANPLVAHQVNGLANPLDAEHSTLIIHIQLVVEGIVHSFTKPIGSGTGATNQAGSKLGAGGGETEPTEIDISNQFVALGPVGGMLYAAAVLLTLLLAVRGYFAGRDVLLGVLGLLVVGGGQWLSGGHWFLAPMTWLLAGTVAALWARPTPEPPPEPAPVR